MFYPVAIEPGDAEHAFGVVVPDLEGAFSAGDTFEEALANASEAIQLQLEALLDEGKPLPAPTKDLAALAKRPEFAGWLWAMVPINIEQLDNEVERVNVSIPRRVLKSIDAAAKRAGETRSAFLATSALTRARELEAEEAM